MFFYLNNTPIFFYKEYKTLTIIQFCDLINVVIPRFCYHEKLSIAGNCRMCLVEMNNGIKPVIACATNISANIEIALDSLLVKKARENVLEFLLINHPLDCPICDQGGECDLQDQTVVYGSDRGRFKEMKRSVEDKELGPVVKTIMTRCIHCTRCIRFSDEILGIKDLGVIGRGSSSEIKMNNVFFLDHELSGNIVDVCPVGALTSKPYAFTARPWDLKSIESIDVLDSLHSNIRVDIKGSRILRILPKINEQLNENWISDYTRFSYESVQGFRIKYPYLSLNKSFFGFTDSDLFLRLGWEQCIEFFNILINLKNFNLFNFFISSGIGLFNSSFFYFITKFIKNSNFLIESLPSFNIDSRSSYYVDSFNNFMKSNYFIFYNINLKENFSVFNSRMQSYLNNSFYKKFIFYIGLNIKHTYSVYHIGNSASSFFSLLRGKNLNVNYFNSLVKKNASFNLFSSDISFNSYLSSLGIFDNLSVNNFNFYSNISGYFDFGMNSDLLNNHDVLAQQNLFSYYYKTNKVENNNSFFVYHGNYLPLVENVTEKNNNYVFLPSSNLFEVEDSYINIFGDLQLVNQSQDFSEKESIKSDFYIFKNILFSFFNYLNKSESSSFYSIDFIFNELVFYYLNYFFIFFDIFPYMKNYNKNSLNVQSYSSSYYLKHFIFNLSVRDSFFATYSSTLRSFYKIRDSKKLSSFC
jgi:NADH-quinone oxidoreductase chain G